MTAVHCFRAEFLIERRAAGLSAAESLRLEEHLSGCESCSTQARLLGGLRALARGAKASLSPQARSRAIEGALADAGRKSERATRPATMPWALPAGLGFASAAALAVALGLFR